MRHVNVSNEVCEHFYLYSLVDLMFTLEDDLHFCIHLVRKERSCHMPQFCKNNIILFDFISRHYVKFYVKW